MTSTKGDGGGARWEVFFVPTKRWVDGEHQPDISYRFPAASLDDAKSQATHWLRMEHPRASYRFQKAKELGA